jgi:hypothetical protein
MTKWVDAAEVRAQIRETSVRLEMLLAGLSVDQINRPGAVGVWSIKDVLAHIAFWERYVSSIIKAVERGETPILDAEDSTETRNASVVAQYYQRPLSAVIAEWHAAREELLDLLEDISEAALNDPNHFAWSGGRTLLDRIAGNSYGHEQEHIEQIREWMRSL